MLTKILNLKFKIRKLKLKLKLKLVNSHVYEEGGNYNGKS